jgi:hypothetical protein
MQSEFSVVRKEMNERFDNVDQRIGTLTNAVDHLVSEYDILVTEEAANAEKFNRLSDKIYEHDQEITKLKKLAKA